MMIKQFHYFNNLKIFISSNVLYMGFFTSAKYNNSNSKFNVNNVSQEIQEKKKQIKYDYETIKNIVMESNENTKVTIIDKNKPIKKKTIKK